MVVFIWSARAHWVFTQKINIRCTTNLLCIALHGDNCIDVANCPLVPDAGGTNQARGIHTRRPVFNIKRLGATRTYEYLWPG
jgi:hypothetical protein